MKFFKTPDDLDGYGIFVEAEDITEPLDLPELKSAWADILWEGVAKRKGYYIAYYLTSNSHMLEFIFPDESWLAVELRETLEIHCSDV